MTDNELIAGCIKENRRCQNELYKKYFPLMSNLALRYTNDSEEAIHKLNSGFLKILQNMSDFDSQYSLATFIRNILVNHLIDEFRKEKKYFANIQLTEYSETTSGATYNLGEINMEAEELLEILNHLPEMTRKVFNLFAIDGYQHNEIAEMLEISTGTSKWHVSEARKKLKEVLEIIKMKEKNRSKSV
jgi:RNA polymerase sigma factor (sigma-70 family)